ncbi:hypothetical protein [Anditalea andensis]|uniref:Uncharacterized protein n=1 Tax=Anditalea andensis TaxID=1048983 RepID=A0A074KZF7_9BACT|nr:hypothetical protein [Anditalea andensis]KEO75376.1 hypothetical protein EL17_02225 [Anditalea andensis]
MKRLFTTMAIAILFSMMATYAFFYFMAEAKIDHQFKSLYHQVQMFIGSERDYFNKVTYPLSAPEVAYRDFFIEIVPQGPPDNSIWSKWGLSSHLNEVEPEFFVQKVKHISITTDKHFLGYDPGEDISDLFKVKNKHHQYEGNSSEETLLRQLTEIKVNDFSSFLYTLSKGPEHSGIYQFTFNYVLSDGKILTASSQQLNLRGER